MDIFNTEIFLDGFQFTEGLRWHNNNLWFCDLGGNTVYCFRAMQLTTPTTICSIRRHECLPQKCGRTYGSFSN